MGECRHESRTATVAVMVEQCAEHGHPKMVGAAFDPDGVDTDAVIRGILSVLEQVIAARYISEDGPLKELVESEFPGGTLDDAEKPRLANLIANQLLLLTVRRRSYSAVAKFGILPVEGYDS